MKTSHTRNTVRFYGYHTTDSKNIDKIIEPTDFIPSVKNDTWLGEGIYFWTDYSNALDWATFRGYGKDFIIYKCLLECPVDNYFDLDDTDNINVYNNFVISYYDNFKSNKEENNESIEKMRPINKTEAWSYLVSLFCKKNDIYLIKRTFEHLSKKQKGLMGHLKTQICVRNAYKGEIIKEMELVYE